ncbi:MAG: hypothetical protein WCJ57_02440 [Candidatus Falkowbacteria bacterium]
MKNLLRIGLVTIFVVLVSVYYFANLEISLDKTLLTISTFLFAIFSGFFISRQSSRYGDIRKSDSVIDGNFSAIYRSSSHLGLKFQKKMGELIKVYYSNILSNDSWDYNFTNKTTTLSDIHALLEKNFGGKTLTSLENSALGRIMMSLGAIQQERKNLVALYEERIPVFEWIPIWFLAGVLILTLSTTVSSYLSLLDSVLKGIFGTSVLVIVILLKRLDSLRLFEGIIGEHSARDVVDIIDGRK